MSLPLISVIITNYNYDKYIIRAIQSVFNQTYTNIELIIINDGSTDNSDELINRMVTKHANVIYVNQENRGISYARNEGLANITGDYFIFLDADNYWSDDYLEKFYHKAISSDADVVYGDLRQLDTKDDLVSETNFPTYTLERLLFENFIDISALVKSNIAKKYKFDLNLNKRSHEDWDYWLSLALEKHTFVKCDQNYLNYMIHNQSRNKNTNNTFQKWEGLLETFNYIWNKYQVKYSDVLKENDWAIGHSKLLYTLLADQSQVVKYLTYLEALSNQKITVYYRIENYSEEQKIVFEFNYKDQLSFTIPDGTTEIRVDLTELPSFYTYVTLVDETNEKIESFNTNGFKEEDCFYFVENDPQIYYKVRDYQERIVTLKYSMSDMSDVLSEAYPSKIILNSNLRLAEEKKRLVKEKQQIISKKQQLQARYEQLELDYQQVINSKTWQARLSFVKLDNWVLRRK